MNLTNYLLTVAKINYQTFGGASLSTPLYYKYYVDENIIDEQQVSHFLAMANVLPGAMSIYMTGYTGLYLHGKKGMVLGVGVLFIPLIFITIMLYHLLLITNIDLSYLIYIPLPMMTISAYEFVKRTCSKSNLNIFLFVLGMIILLFISSLNLIFIFLGISYIYTKVVRHA